MSVGGLEISEIKITPVKKVVGSLLQAHAKVVLNSQLAIAGIRVVQGKFGPFVSFPRTFKAGEGFNLCYPITKEFQDYISERILRQWRAMQ